MEQKSKETEQELVNLKVYWEIRDHVVAMGMLPPSLKYVSAIVQAYDNATKNN